MAPVTEFAQFSEADITATDNPFKIEEWTEYGAGLCILICRIFCRWRTVGCRWDGDDYLTILAIILWTVQLTLIHVITRLGAIIRLTDDVAVPLTEEQKERIVIGSKCLFAAWCVYATMLWVLKACMLCLYYRITLDLKQRKWVNIAAVCCVAAYVAVVLAIMTRCMPLDRNWQIDPYPGDACVRSLPSFVVVVAANIATDFIIACVPMPLLWKARMSWRRKVVCGFWLCASSCVIIVTMMRCIFGLRDFNDVNVRSIWAVREQLIAIICVNVSVLGPYIIRGARQQSLASSEGAPIPDTRGNSMRSLHQFEGEEGRRRGQLGPGAIGAGNNEHIVKRAHETPSGARLITTSVRTSDSRVADGLDGRSWFDD